MKKTLLALIVLSNLNSNNANSMEMEVEKESEVISESQKVVFPEPGIVDLHIKGKNLHFFPSEKEEETHVYSNYTKDGKQLTQDIEIKYKQKEIAFFNYLNDIVIEAEESITFCGSYFFSSKGSIFISAKNINFESYDSFCIETAIINNDENRLLVVNKKLRHNLPSFQVNQQYNLKQKDNKIYIKADKVSGNDIFYNKYAKNSFIKDIKFEDLDHSLVEEQGYNLFYKSETQIYDLDSLL